MRAFFNINCLKNPLPTDVGQEVLFLKDSNIFFSAHNFFFAVLHDSIDTILNAWASLLLQDLIDYYNTSTSRDWTGRVKSFKATGSIGDGLMPILHKSAPQVALFSARGPNIRDFNFQEADLLKPDILAPGSLIWAAWSPNGTDEANYVGNYQ